MKKNNILAMLSWLAIQPIFLLYFKLFNGYNYDSLSIYLSISSILLFFINWSCTGQGKNPSFLFIGFSILFLFGRAIPAIFGSDSKIQLINFGDGYVVDYDIVVNYGFYTLASLFLVSFGSIIFNKYNTIQNILSDDFSKKFFLWIFIFSLPGYLLKNYYYFDYILNNGGYLAIYQSDDHVKNISIWVRISSLFCLSSFTLYFFYESNKKNALISIILFSIIFSMELLVGLRGKFFVTLTVLLLFYKIRFDEKFTIKSILSMFLIIIVLAIFIEITREQKDSSSIDGNIITGFFAQQGVTAGVNLFLMENYNNFHNNGFNYLIKQFAAPFYNQSEAPTGWFLANDVSMVLQPDAFALGYGTGSSYFAELFLIFKGFSLLLGSFLIGIICGFLKKINHGFFGAISFWIVCGVVYYPRTMLHDPVHNLYRYLPIIIILIICCQIFKYLFKKNET